MLKEKVGLVVHSILTVLTLLLAIAGVFRGNLAAFLAGVLAFGLTWYLAGLAHDNYEAIQLRKMSEKSKFGGG